MASQIPYMWFSELVALRSYGLSFIALPSPVKGRQGGIGRGLNDVSGRHSGCKLSLFEEEEPGVPDLDRTGVVGVAGVDMIKICSSIATVFVESNVSSILKLFHFLFQTCCAGA
jgi:hypothetical protein